VAGPRHFTLEQETLFDDEKLKELKKSNICWPGARGETQQQSTVAAPQNQGPLLGKLESECCEKVVQKHGVVLYFSESGTRANEQTPSFWISEQLGCLVIHRVPA
jgi:hypothetical protein